MLEGDEGDNNSIFNFKLFILYIEEKFNEKELICSKCSFIEKLYNCP